MAADTWHYYAAIRDTAARQMSFFANGEPLGAPVGYLENTSGGSATDLWLGRCQTTAGWELNGDIDEVRLVSTARSPAWIRAQYLSVSGQFIRYGTPQP